MLLSFGWKSIGSGHDMRHQTLRYLPRRSKALSLTLVGFAVYLICDSAFSSAFQDADLKAVYLYRIAPMIEWRSNVRHLSKTYFCIDVTNAVSDKLKLLIDEKMDDAVLAIIDDSAVNSDICQIVYTRSINQDFISDLRQRYPASLLVGDGWEFIHAGGMIAFIKVNNRIRPLVSMKNLEGLPLSLSAQFLEIAMIYEERK